MMCPVYTCIYVCMWTYVRRLSRPQRIDLFPLSFLSLLTFHLLSISCTIEQLSPSSFSGALWKRRGRRRRKTGVLQFRLLLFPPFLSPRVNRFSPCWRKRPEASLLDLRLFSTFSFDFSSFFWCMHSCWFFFLAFFRFLFSLPFSQEISGLFRVWRAKSSAKFWLHTDTISWRLARDILLNLPLLLTHGRFFHRQIHLLATEGE